MRDDQYEFLSGGITEIKQELGHIRTDISDMKVIQAKQHVILDEHIQRTTQLEKVVELIQKDRAIFIAALKILCWCGGGVTFLAGVVEIVEFFRSFSGH